MKHFHIKILLVFLFSFSFNLAQENRSLDFINTDWNTHGDFVYLGSPDYGFGNKLTVTAWVKWKIDPASQPYINGHETEGKWANLVTIAKYNAFDDGQFWLQHSSVNANYEFAVKTTSGRNFIQSTTVPIIDKWVFLVGVYNDDDPTASLKFYIDGNLESSNNSLSGILNPYNTVDRLCFGRVPAGYRLFTGELDEIRIYKRALTQDEIRNQMFSKTTVDATDLLSYWSLDAISGTTVNDEGPDNFDGVFYTALVDVHSPLSTPPPYKINDGDKSWAVNQWSDKTLKTVAGAGVDETNIISSNTSNTLTLQNPWGTTPILDGQTNMTWFGIEDATESAQWISSTAPISSNSAFVNTTTPTTVGSGGTISVTITSTPDATNNLMLYQLGSSSGLAVTSGETFPSGVTKRSNIILGINEWGSVTANIIIDYSGVGGVTDASSIKLLNTVRDISPIVWTEVTPTSRDNTARTFNLNAQTVFYEYALGSNENNQLPVELSSFSAITVGSTVKLSWQTATEINNYGFDVERKIGSLLSTGSNFEVIGFVNGNGNSNSQKSYSFEDKNITTGNYSYRLKQIDNDGGFEYSKTIEVKIENIPTEFSLNQNYPNPFNPSTTIRFTISEAGNVKLKVYDLLGQEVRTLVNEFKEVGSYTINFDASNLNSGMYVYKIEAGSFTQTRKMTLLK